MWHSLLSLLHCFIICMQAVVKTSKLCLWLSKIPGRITRTIGILQSYFAYSIFMASPIFYGISIIFDNSLEHLIILYFSSSLDTCERGRGCEVVSLWSKNGEQGLFYGFGRELRECVLGIKTVILREKGAFFQESCQIWFWGILLGKIFVFWSNFERIRCYFAWKNSNLQGAWKFVVTDTCNSTLDRPLHLPVRGLKDRSKSN